MWLRTGVKLQIFYEYPQKSVSRQILDRGHYSIKLRKEGQKDLQSHRYSKQMLDRMFTKVSDNRN